MPTNKQRKHLIDSIDGQIDLIGDFNLKIALVEKRENILKLFLHNGFYKHPRSEQMCLIDGFFLGVISTLHPGSMLNKK